MTPAKTKIKKRTAKKTPRAVRSGVRVKKIARKRAGRVALSARVIDLRPPRRARAPRKNKRKSVRSPFVALAPRVLLKLLAATLMVSLNGAGLLGVGYTAAYYNDHEDSSGNAFAAGSVDFSLSAIAWNPLQASLNMQPGTTTTKTFALNEGLSNPFQYFASTTLMGGDVPFCNGINVSLTQASTTLFTGALSALVTATTTSTTTLALSATTGTNNFQNSVCLFGLDFNGWQTRHEYLTFEDGGFNDTERATTTLASWGFRLNKVYYDVETPERGEEGDNEWVEIYNQTNVPLDISNWEICDNTSCDTIPAGTPTVSAQGYAMITNNPNTASATGTAPWYLPPGVVYIPLGENIGNGLHNDADMLVLKRPDGVVIDQMNYGTPDPSWVNYAAYQSGIWDPGATDVAEGNLLARIPSGYDTDQASDWHEITPPALDLIYPDEGASYTWYWTHTYTIRWTATNPNGPDSALSIALFYILDEDNSHSITPVDTTHTITLATDNDGAYKWKVPSGFIGYIWITLVATGPENPLNNTRTVSGKIYDPEPIFIGPEGIDPEDLDLIAPVITILGDNPTLVPLGAAFEDLGADVSDNVSQNLSYATLGEVDTAVLGEYAITYTAFDEMGNTATSTRAVIVYDPAVGPPTFEEPAPDPVADESALGTGEEQEANVGNAPVAAGEGQQQDTTAATEIINTLLTVDAAIKEEGETTTSIVDEEGDGADADQNEALNTPTEEPTLGGESSIPEEISGGETSGEILPDALSIGATEVREEEVLPPEEAVSEAIVEAPAEPVVTEPEAPSVAVESAPVEPAPAPAE